jgi:hypothetical protein
MTKVIKTYLSKLILQKHINSNQKLFSFEKTEFIKSPRLFYKFSFTQIQKNIIFSIIFSQIR